MCGVFEMKKKIDILTIILIIVILFIFQEICSAEGMSKEVSLDAFQFYLALTSQSIAEAEQILSIEGANYSENVRNQMNIEALRAECQQAVSDGGSSFCQKIRSSFMTCVSAGLGALCGTAGGFMVGWAVSEWMVYYFLGGWTGYLFIDALLGQVVSETIIGRSMISGATLGAQLGKDWSNSPDFQLQLLRRASNPGEKILEKVNFHNRFGQFYQTLCYEHGKEFESFVQFIKWMTARVKLRIVADENGKLSFLIPLELAH